MATVFHNPVSFTRCLYVNYTNETFTVKWCRLQESNPQPTDYKSVALPIVLSRHGLNERIWTFDNLIPNQELFQTELHSEKWLGHLDSNQGNARFRVWCLTTWLHPNKNMADSEGLEPSTKRLTAVCSTHWAISPWMHNIYRYVGKQAIHLAFLCKCCTVNLLKDCKEEK